MQHLSYKKDYKMECFYRLNYKSHIAWKSLKYFHVKCLCGEKFVI